MNDIELKTHSDTPATFTDYSNSWYLSAEAQSLMALAASTPTDSLPYESQTTLYLMAVSRDPDIAVAKLADTINTLVSKQLVLSTLTSLRTSELSPMPKTHEGFVAYCNMLVPHDRLADAKAIARDYYYEPGMAINNTDSLIKELPIGQFYCNIEVSLWANFTSGTSSRLQAEEEVENILRLLPKGTSLVSLRECGIRGLAVPYEAIFSHELLADIKEVEIEYVYRIVEIEDRYKNVRLPVKIKYLARDGKTSIV